MLVACGLLFWYSIFCEYASDSGGERHVGNSAERRKNRKTKDAACRLPLIGEQGRSVDHAS